MTAALTQFVDVETWQPSQIFKDAIGEVIEEMIELGSLEDTDADRARIILAVRMTFQKLATR